jgi:hypothetical protein
LENCVFRSDCVPHDGGCREERSVVWVDEGDVYEIGGREEWGACLFVVDMTQEERSSVEVDWKHL